MEGVRKKTYVWIIGLVIFGFVLMRVDVPHILVTFSEVKVFYIVLAFLLTAPLIAIKTYRWKCLLKAQDMDYGFKAAFLVYLASIYIGIVAPGRTGEFIRCFYLKKDKNVSFSKAFSNVLVDRLFDLFALITVACLGLAVSSLPRRESLVILAAVSVIILATGVILSKKLTGRVIQFTYKVRTLRTYKERIDESVDDFYSGLEELRKSRLVIPLLMTVLAYLLFYAQGYLVVKSLNIPISFFYLVFCMSLVSLVALLPISILGIGTRDATLIALFSAQGLTKEAAVSLSLGLLFVFYLSTGGIGALAWLKRPVSLHT